MQTEAARTVIPQHPELKHNHRKITKMITWIRATGRKRSLFIPISRNAMSKNVKTTVQLHLFHMLARSCLKSFKLGFSSTWTKNFQMFKVDLEKAWNNWLVQNLEKSLSRLILSPCLFNLYAEHIMRNAGAGWLTNWNQDCWQKYQ